MSRKDFQLIADTIAGMFPEDENRRAYVAETFAYHLASNNPRFDRERFLVACGVSEECI